MGQLSKTLYELMSNFFMNYKGIIIEKDNGQFIVHKQIFPTLEEAKRFIDTPKPHHHDTPPNPIEP